MNIWRSGDQSKRGVKEDFREEVAFEAFRFASKVIQAERLDHFWVQRVSECQSRATGRTQLWISPWWCLAIGWWVFPHQIIQANKVYEIFVTCPTKLHLMRYLFLKKNSNIKPSRTPQTLLVMAPSSQPRKQGLWSPFKFLLSSTLPILNWSPILVGSASLKMQSICIYWTSLLGSGKQRWIRQSQETHD